jgi:biopolymer transport protein ExbB/TolQ
MLVEASITGVVRMILIIIGVLVVLRFIGQLMQAKKNMEEERALNERDRKLRNEKERKRNNLGKTKLLRKDDRVDAEDVDFKEVK